MIKLVGRESVFLSAQLAQTMSIKTKAERRVTYKFFISLFICIHIHSLKGGGTKMIPIARPRIVVEGGDVFYIFRDVERGSCVSMAHAAVPHSKV
mgnify:CR=1 FL=1